MWAFQYKHGDRPLEGYTIQRAAGRGGFGEVYYATSDSGREVALKVVQGYEQIELRGITQCMNLKSPYLVSIFDVKYNELGRPFVIMEYVSGPNLRQMLDEHPAGLGTQKAAFFLREIGKGLQYLHDCGIVHRDLKPGNIFFENGYVKIGDYGLSKAISVSQHSGQTVTVGTVHYMAPEIGAGKYDRSIDIYAMGAVLYELLTGVPPFVGASPTEVLMKHLSAEADLTNVEEPFKTAIKKAMAKDPAHRFKSIQEMVESVFGAETIQASLREFSEQELSMVAGRVAAKVLAGAAAGAGSATFSPSSMVGSPGLQPPPLPSDDRRFGRNATASTERGRQSQRGAAVRGADHNSTDSTEPLITGWTERGVDSVPLPARFIMAITCTFAVAAAVALFGSWRRLQIDPILVGVIAATGAGAAAAIMMTSFRYLARSLRGESAFVQRLSVAGPAAVAACVVTLPLFMDNPKLQSLAPSTIIAVVVGFVLSDVRQWLNPGRLHRAAPGLAVGPCVIAFIATMVFGGSGLIAVGILAATAMAVQLIAPWGLPADPGPLEDRYTIGGLGIKTERMARSLAGNVTPLAADPNDIACIAAPLPPPVVTAAQFPRVGRRVPTIWLAAFVALTAVGIAFCIVAAQLPYDRLVIENDSGPRRLSYELSAGAITATAIGVNSLIAAAFALQRAFVKRFRGWWPYALRPTLRFLCVATIVTGGIILGNTDPSAAAIALGTFFIIVSALSFILITLVPARWFDPQAVDAAPRKTVQGVAVAEPGVSPRKRLWALLLASLGFAGAGGLHRFYCGKIGTGILYLITGGFFSIGTIIDIIAIASGKFTDSAGRRVLRWEDEPLSGDVIARAKRESNDWMSDVVRSVSSALGQTNHAGARAAEMARAAGGGVLSALAALFLFAGSITLLAVATDVPGMIDSGRPDPKIRAQVHAGLAEFIALRSSSSTPAAARARDADPAAAEQLAIERAARSAPPAGMATGAVDDLAIELREQTTGFEQEIARAIVASTRDAVQGDFGVARAALTVKNYVTAANAYRDAMRSLEEARRSLAAMERARIDASRSAADARSGPAAGVIVPFIPPPAAARTPPVAAAPSVAPGELLERAVNDRQLTLELGNLNGGLTSIRSRVDLRSESSDAVAPTLRLLGVLASGTLLTIGTALLMFARRKHGASHLLRGVAGVAAIVVAMAVLNHLVIGSNFWSATAADNAAQLADAALRVLNSPPAYASGAIALTSLLLLAWPPRRLRIAGAVAIAATTPSEA